MHMHELTSGLFIKMQAAAKKSPLPISRLMRLVHAHLQQMYNITDWQSYTAGRKNIHVGVCSFTYGVVSTTPCLLWSPRI